VRVTGVDEYAVPELIFIKKKKKTPPKKKPKKKQKTEKE
jgi:hypothetical protein